MTIWYILTSRPILSRKPFFILLIFPAKIKLASVCLIPITAAYTALNNDGRSFSWFAFYRVNFDCYIHYWRICTLDITLKSHTKQLSDLILCLYPSICRLCLKARFVFTIAVKLQNFINFSLPFFLLPGLAVIMIACSLIYMQASTQPPYSHMHRTLYFFSVSQQAGTWRPAKIKLIQAFTFGYINGPLC